MIVQNKAARCVWLSFWIDILLNLPKIGKKGFKDILLLLFFITVLTMDFID